MNLPDSFYIALCMTILLVGAVYWVWTQIQYVQRKVNVLENIVYELKTLCTRPPEGGPIAPTNYPPAPPSVLGEDEDLLHETLAAEVVTGGSGSGGSSSAPYATVEEVDSVIEPPVPTHVVAPWPATALTTESAEPVIAASQEPESVVQEVDVVPDFSEPVFDMGHYVVEGSITKGVEGGEKEGEGAADLQPGGVGSGVVAPSLQSSLEGMTLKELRRLAQQKSISGANEMKKRELIEAIRAVPIESFLE